MKETAQGIVDPNLTELQNRTIRKLFLRLLPFLFFLYVVNYLDRINVGFAALQMQSQLGFSDRVYGIGAGIFFAGYFLFQLPSNLALARVGARRWIAAIMVCWGIVSSCMIFVRTVHEFYGLRFLLGIAEAGFFPGVILYLRNWFPEKARARAIAWFVSAAPIAGVLGGPISGALLELHTGPFAGWQWLFLIEGTPAVLLGAAALALLSDRPESVTWLSSEEKTCLISVLSNEENVRSTKSAAWSSVFANVNVWLLTIVYFGITTCMYGLIYFLPKVIRSVSSSSNFTIGLLSAIPFLATVIAMVLTGMLSDRTGERRRYLVLLALAGAIGAWAAGYATSTTATVVCLSLAMLSAFSTMSPFWALSTTVLSETTAAAGIAIINSFGNFGGFFGPYMIGSLRNSLGGFRGGMTVVGASLLMAGLVALLPSVQKQDTSS